jgi:D-glycero-alpha-D-manno-heptose 1-phosphate guanylyltransferase
MAVAEKAIEQPLVVLAGGFGTRLRSVVADLPKPMAPAGPHPFLWHLLDAWAGQGVRRFVFALHHEAGVIEQHLREQQSHGVLRGCEVRTVTEPRPLGTGGAIANAVREGDVTASFLVANADTWLGAGVRDVSVARSPAIAVVRVDNTERYGSVRRDGDAVTSFAEKQHSAGAGWINAGLYHLEAESFQSWNGEAFSLEADLFPRWADAGQLSAVPVEASFVDIGIPEDYFRFCRWVETGKTGAL